LLIFLFGRVFVLGLFVLLLASFAVARAVLLSVAVPDMAVAVAMAPVAVVPDRTATPRVAVFAVAAVVVAARAFVPVPAVVGMVPMPASIHMMSMVAIASVVPVMATPIVVPVMAVVILVPPMAMMALTAMTMMAAVGVVFPMAVMAEVAVSSMMVAAARVGLVEFLHHAHEVLVQFFLVELPVAVGVHLVEAGFRGFQHFVLAKFVVVVLVELVEKRAAVARSASRVFFFRSVLRLYDADASDQRDRREPSDCLTSHGFRLQVTGEKEIAVPFRNASPLFRRAIAFL
jgi:hypothetical protein